MTCSFTSSSLVDGPFKRPREIIYFILLQRIAARVTHFFALFFSVDEKACVKLEVLKMYSFCCVVWEVGRRGLLGEYNLKKK